MNYLFSKFFGRYWDFNGSKGSNGFVHVNILNQKRNFRKIGLRGGHTRYERKKNRHLPQMKLKYQMKLMIFRLYMNFDELIFNHCAITNMNKNC